MKTNNTAPKDELEEFSQEQLQTVDDIIEKNRWREGALIPVLEKVQDILGFLPRAIQRRVANGLNIPIAKVKSDVDAIAGPDEGWKLIERQPDIQFIAVQSDGSLIGNIENMEFIYVTDTIG